MHRVMMTYVREWIRQNYSTTCLLIGDKEHEISVILNREEIPQKVKDIDNYLSDELISRDKEVNNNSWNVNNNMHVPKKKIHDKIVEAKLENSEVTDITDQSGREKEIDSSIKGSSNDRKGEDKRNKEIKVRILNNVLLKLLIMLSKL